MGITVRFAKVKDALGRIKESWLVLDGTSICGICKTEGEAIKRADAIKSIRRCSR